MTPEEAEKVSEILALADGGCSNCSNELVGHMEEEFPDFPWDERVRFYRDMEYELREKLTHQRFEECLLVGKATATQKGGQE